MAGATPTRADMTTASCAQEDERRLRAIPQRSCFVCGQDNPSGLRIQYQEDDTGAITAVWRPALRWEGFLGIIHGGVVSTVLDEAMSKAVALQCEALTAELRVRFRRQVVSGGTFAIRGWVSNRTKRRIETEATLTAPDGTEHAHAWAVFLALPEAGSRTEPGQPAPV